MANRCDIGSPGATVVSRSHQGRRLAVHYPYSCYSLLLLACLLVTLGGLSLCESLVPGISPAFPCLATKRVPQSSVVSSCVQGAVLHLVSGLLLVLALPAVPVPKQIKGRKSFSDFGPNQFSGIHESHPAVFPAPNAFTRLTGRPQHRRQPSIPQALNSTTCSFVQSIFDCQGPVCPFRPEVMCINQPCMHACMQTEACHSHVCQCVSVSTCQIHSSSCLLYPIPCDQAMTVFDKPLLPSFQAEYESCM